MNSPAEDLLFAEGPGDAPHSSESSTDPWLILVADDEPDVHSVTSLALRGFRFEGRPLKLLHAFSGRQAVELMAANPDVAMVLMDVVMETEHAGLDAVQAIRKQLKNQLVRIVLRTGQPGQAPEREVVTQYDINDYKEKTELTAKKLFTAVYTVLGYYRQLLAAEAHRESLQQLVDELRRSNRDLNDYAYIASHDLSSPINAISGFSSLIEKRYAKDLPDEAREYLGFILQSTRRMKQLIDDLLALAQVGQRGTPALVDLNKCLAQVMEMLEPGIRGSDAEIQSGALVKVVGIETELRQLLANLLANAIKFQRPGQRPRVLIATEEAEGFCHLTVDDNGIGIEPAHRSQLFTLFRRLHLSDQFEGTGLGLAICRKVAENHGGGITIGDSPLGGARFTVKLRHIAGHPQKSTSVT